MEEVGGLGRLGEAMLDARETLKVPELRHLQESRYIIFASQKASEHREKKPWLTGVFSLNILIHVLRTRTKTFGLVKTACHKKSFNYI